VSGREVTVNEADLRRVLDEVVDLYVPEELARLRAALDALGPEPCGHKVERIAEALDADHVANGFALGRVEYQEHRRMAALVLYALAEAK